MRIVVAVAGVFLSSSLLSFPAMAETVRGTVKAGTTTIVMARYSTAPGCISWAPPEAEGRPTAPNGRVSVSVERLRITEAGTPCHGSTVSATVIRYTPNKGFRGEERFTVNYAFDAHDGGLKVGISDDFVLQVQ